MAKDWTGNSKSVYTTLGANNHIDEDRAEYDFYATDPKAAELLCEFTELSSHVWEPACGEGHLVKPLEEHGYQVTATDIVTRYSDALNRYVGDGVDFLSLTKDDEIVRVLSEAGFDIVTNPPYKYAKEFVEKSMELLPNGHKAAMFLKLQFLESKHRKDFFAKYPPRYVYVSSDRIMCARNGDFDGLKKSGGSAIAYAWYIWEKGYTGETTLRWFN